METTRYRADLRQVDTPSVVFVVLMALVLAPAGVAEAESIDVTNAGFELSKRYGGPILDGQSSLSVYGWVVTIGGGAIGGALNPTTEHFPGEAPEGQIVAWSDHSRIYQPLDAVLLANTTYTLQVEVGNRLDVSFAGYRIRFATSGSTGVVLVEDQDTVTPANGTFETTTLSFSTGSTHAELGEQLQIELFGFPGTGQNHAYFDNVRLDATTVPEPTGVIGLLSMLLVGLVGFAWRRGRVR